MSAFYVVRHTSKRKLGQPTELLRGLKRDLLRSRHFAVEMLVRDIRSQFRTSLSGLLIPLLPALTTTIWAILFRDAHIINVGNVGVPYPFFALFGMMVWASFLESIDAPVSGLHAEQNLLAKTSLPSEAITLARLGQVFFNFSLKALIVAIAAIIYRVHIHWTVIFAPLGLLMIISLGTAIGLVLAPLNLLYTDIAKALPMFTSLWFFITPIIFSSPGRGWAATLMTHNPVTPLLVTTRELAFGGGLSMSTGFGFASAFTLGLTILAAAFHRVAMPIVIDRANA